jgi:RNA polymerase sigma-70 factor (ECF subfamily)
MSAEKRIISGRNAITNDKDLVVRLIHNDQEAFCELYARYKKQLLYFAMKFVKSHEFAEDIYQDAFTVIGISEIEMYFCRLVTNKFVG